MSERLMVGFAERNSLMALPQSDSFRYICAESILRSYWLD